MRRLLTLLMWCLAGMSARAAVVPIFINDSPLVLPDAGLATINTAAFVNQSTFTVTPFSFNFGIGGVTFAASTATLLPFETFNTRFYTNESTGVMEGSVGFRFMYTHGRTRTPASWFVNDGTIGGNNYLEIKADNVSNSGSLDAGPAGLIRIAGKAADLTRSRLRSGQAYAPAYFGGENDFPRRGQYENAFGVSDVYWAIGSNGAVNAGGRITPLNSLNFNLPSPSTPSHQVETLLGRRLSTNRVSLPKTFFTGTNFVFNSTNFVIPTNFAAFVYNSTVDGTAAIVQVVFVRTNSTAGNTTANVTFDTFPFLPDGTDPVVGPTAPIVEIQHWDFDPSLDLFVTNSFFLTDTMAVRTNLSYYRNVSSTTLRPTSTRRPVNYEFALSEFSLSSFGFGVPANGTYTNGMLTTGYLSNSVQMQYSAYAANVFTNVTSQLAQQSLFSNVFIGAFSSVGAIRPTNLPGRVEIFSDKLNLESTRLRSESTVFVRTKDLEGSKLARLVDAPFVGFDLTSKQPSLILTNITPPTIQRLSGMICAWSSQWKNYQVDPVTQTTNEINFHVLFVDHDLRASVVPEVFHFAVHANHLVIGDPVNLYRVFDPIKGRKLLIDSPSLDVRGSLNFPFGAAWASTNVLRLVNFTNYGSVTVPGAAKYGTDRAAPYNSIINPGTNTAASQLARVGLFENSGALLSSAGPVQIDAVTARIEGAPLVIVTNVTPLISFNITNFLTFEGYVVTNGFFTNITYPSLGARVASYSDLQIKAGDLSVSNSLLAAGGFNTSFLYPGRLVLSVTNRLVDAGPDARNYWSDTTGFEMRKLPATSSLLGTWLSTTAGINAQSVHVWPAQDFGAVARGFSNNLALGKLSINISANNGRAVFRSASGQQAMYVDYIEVFNDATNFNGSIGVDPRMTIYFANANVDIPKLDGALNGRFRWVPSFAGPLSSTNITYPSGSNYTFNVALVSSKNIDSDGDGCVNADDPTPIPVEGENTMDCSIFEAAARAFRPLAETATAASATSVAGLSPTGEFSGTRLLVDYEGGAQPRVRLSWPAPARSETVIEYADDWNLKWEVLRSVDTGETPGPVTVYDAIPRDARMRLYRLRIVPVSTR